MPDDIFLPPQPPRPFIGRERELTWLEEELWHGEFSTGRPIVITGAAGIGKTALVAEALSRERFVSVSVSAQIGRERPEPPRRMSNGKRPNFPVWMSARTMRESFEEFRALTRHLYDERDRRDVVVVLDGLDELPEEQRLEASSRIYNHKIVKSVIITSRAVMGLRGERTFHLEELPRVDAESLISDISGSLITPDSIGKILGIGAGNPAALSLLAELAKKIGPEQLRNVLAGHLYDLKDAGEAEQRELITVAKPIIISANKAMIEGLKKQPKDIFNITPRQYEELVAELMHDMGYEVTLTPATRDGGKDILASMKTACGDFLMLVEAKHYRASNKIGVSLVRTLYGTLCDYQANSAMLVTTSSFSKDARSLQQKHQYQLKLSDYTDVAGWIQQYGKRS
jgi:hypothetical protein